MLERYFLCEGDRCDADVDARLLPSTSSSSGISPSMLGSLIDGMETECSERDALSVDGALTCSVRVDEDADRTSGKKVQLVGVLRSAACSGSHGLLISPSLSFISSSAASSSRVASSPYPGLEGGSAEIVIPIRCTRAICGVICAERVDVGAVTAGISVILRCTTAVKERFISTVLVVSVSKPGDGGLG